MGVVVSPLEVVGMSNFAHWHIQPFPALRVPSFKIPFGKVQTRHHWWAAWYIPTF